ncbi:MAG: hypothetical protein ABI654_10485 [Betaproteobacteria bacterium]
MSDGIKIAVSGGNAKRGFVVFALLALTLVMARPICDVYRLQGTPSQSGPVAAVGHAHGEASHHADSEPCCAAIDDGTLTVLAASAIPEPTSLSPVPAATTSLLNWRATTCSFAVAIPPDRPPDSLAYCARSARILI